MMTRFALTTLCAMALALTAYADEPAPKPGPSPAALDSTFRQINQQVLDAYVGTLPPTWSTWPQRFDTKLDVNGNLRVATDIMLSSAADNRLRLLSVKEVEDYKCRLESGFVGVGVLFDFKLTLNQGLPIEKVLDSSPAQDANLRAGTTIVAINGTRLEGADVIDALQLLLLDKDPEVKLTVSDGQAESVVVVKRGRGDKLGFEFTFGKTTMTVTVGKVVANSPAEKAGLRQGEVITKINTNTVSDWHPEGFIGQATYGRLGDEIDLTVVRDNADVNLKLKRAIVVNKESAYGCTHVDGTVTLRLTNLDWTKLPEAVDEEARSLDGYTDCVIDLRGAAGENPELAARLAARFIEKLDGDLLCYREKQNGQDKTTRYFLQQRDGKSTLISECGGVETVIEQAVLALEGKLTVLVDEFTSGTAEALASALQRSGLATIAGTETASRSDLVEIKTFTSGDAQLLIEVPAKRLVTGAGYQSLKVKPDQKTASAAEHGRLLALLGVVICLGGVYLAYRLINSVQTPATNSRPMLRRVGLAALVVVAVGSGVYCVVSGVRQASAPKTETPKASAYISNILWTDPEARTNRLRYANADRGKLDAQPKWGAEDHPPTNDAEIKAASRIAEAIAEGDFDTVKEMIESYAHRPYARAQIATSLNYAFNKANVDIHIMCFRGAFMIEKSRGLDEGQASVTFTPLEEPTVNVMVANPRNPGSFTSTDNSEMFDPREVFATFRAPLVRSTQNTRAKGK